MNEQPRREGFIEVPDAERAAQPAPPAPPPAPVDRADEWPVRVKLLHKQVRNNRNEPVDELVFREPTAGDINRYGNPCRIGIDGEVLFDEQKMFRVIAALSGILLPTLEQMDPRDWNSCAYRLRSFFLPEVAAW